MFKTIERVCVEDFFSVTLYPSLYSTSLYSSYLLLQLPFTPATLYPSYPLHSLCFTPATLYIPFVVMVKLR
ncbi:hypothetical protein [Methanosarcina vacuolata]|uniref:Uncharacterized protein n=1 Tax=Methanosarcina vacuolata Z-761 TaxID=1434123 RepID=A0A0E3Q2G1_9EURY|nr:hypothetical protein [Methanosarcina vacuolata]AKB43477.1 hypothetical protein MSVAZ_1208 [Methanosarcina vacuolata Z-761]